MDITQLGNLGEFVGAIAVIVSLVFLAFQVRENSKAVRFDSDLKMRLFVSESQKLLTDRDLARVFREGLSDYDSLDPDDQIRFGNLMFVRINALDISARGSELIGGRDVDEFQAMKRYATMPGFRKWWRLSHGDFSYAFTQITDRYITEAENRQDDA